LRAPGPCEAETWKSRLGSWFSALRL
jgi:hypothetical protein